MKNRFNLKFKAFIFSLTFIAFCLTPNLTFAGDNGNGEFNAGELLLHHVGDDYSWHLATVDGHHYSIPLPVILFVDGSPVIFSSSEFHHAEENGGDGYVKTDNGEFKLDHKTASIIEKNGKEFLDFSFTKNVASMFLASLTLIIIFIAVANQYKKRPGQAPKGLQALIEPLFEYVRTDIVNPFIGESKRATYLPYIATLFFFIWVNNLFGLLPSGANASGNIAFTMTLAVFTMVVTNLSGNKHYWMHILWTPGVPLWMRPIMIIVELIGVVSKPFALMIRLFANITAGHFIILSLVSLIFIFKSLTIAAVTGPVVVAMTMLELFVAALQAYIFSVLTALFIGQAVAEDEHH